ncbi:MAG: hypothetical protein IPL23_08605 [Saprospiraceae bacterium]|nr:hypothetical protein [Saprospiraceae bacterium]
MKVPFLERFGRGAIVKSQISAETPSMRQPHWVVRANWDGKDYTGRKLHLDVYLVFSAFRVDFGTVDSYVTKY